MPIPPGQRPRKESLALSIAQSDVSKTSSFQSGPPSPTFSATTSASTMQGQIVITRADLRDSTRAYEELVTAIFSHRTALKALSHASARVASALERCARLKGASDDCAIGLQSASGLYHLVSNQEQVLSHALDYNVEAPLRLHLDEYRSAIADRSAAYERSLIEKSRLIRKTEKENMNIGKGKRRDLNSFRNALNTLQAQVNELDRLKVEYYSQVAEHEEQVWDDVLNKVSYSVRSTLDVYDRITAKSSDPHLEPLILAIPDPFDSYGPPKQEDQIFSILPPLALSMKPSPISPPATSPAKPSRFNPFSSFTQPPATDPLVNPTNGQYSHSNSTSPDKTTGWMDVIPEAHSRETSMKAPQPIVTSQRWYASEWMDAKSPGLHRGDSSSSRSHTLPSSSMTGTVAFPSFSKSDSEPESPHSNATDDEDDAQTVDGRDITPAESKLRRVLNTSSRRSQGEESDAESSSGAAIWRTSLTAGGDGDGGGEADEEDSDSDSGRRTPVVADHQTGDKTPRISAFHSSEALNGAGSSGAGAQEPGSTEVKAEA